MLVMKCGGVFLPVGPRIATLSPVHNGYLFFDAGGQADKLRNWGAAFVLGRSDLEAVNAIVAELRHRNAAVCRADGEIKGGDLPNSEIQWARRRLRGHYVVLWFNSYPELNSELMTGFWDQLTKFIGGNASEALRAYDSYLGGLKAVNLHKVCSLITHVQRMREVLSGDQIAPMLAQLHLVADQENLPQSDRAAKLVRLFLAANANFAGMMTGSFADLESMSASDGSVSVDLNGRSSESAGLQLVDIMVQGVHRKLDGFPRGFLDNYS